MYDDLYEAWRREKEKKEIQSLPEEFYIRLAEYVKNLREESRMLDEKSLRGKLIRKEKENAKRLIEDLIRTRYEKVMREILSGKIVPAKTLTEVEAELYEGFSLQEETYRTFLRELLRGRLYEVKKEKKSKIMVVRLLQEIPAIIGADMKTYGPFKPEDIASLPVENARILVKQGAAEEVETR